MLHNHSDMYDRLPYSAEEEQTPKRSCIVTLVTPLNFLMVIVFTQAKPGTERQLSCFLTLFQSTFAEG